MKTKDKYLKEKVISLKGYEKAKKREKDQQAEKRNNKIIKLMDQVIEWSNYYRSGLYTREEYKEFLKGVLKQI